MLQVKSVFGNGPDRRPSEFGLFQEGGVGLYGGADGGRRRPRIVYEYI
jgi:hypothetical protein